MKVIFSILASGLLTISSSVFAMSTNQKEIGHNQAGEPDWYCEAYCWIPNEGLTLIFDHASHPVDALNSMGARCAQMSGHGTRLYENQDLSGPQATVSNSCRLFEPAQCPQP